MVRLVVVFLQNILKQKVINFDDVNVDIKQFCVEHNSVKECQEMLKKVIAEVGFQKDTRDSKEP